MTKRQILSVCLFIYAFVLPRVPAGGVLGVPDFFPKAHAAGTEKQLAEAVETRKIAVVPVEMVLLSAGTFLMGDAIDDYLYERPVHSVTISSFYIDKYETTKVLWDEVSAWAGDNGYSFDNPGTATGERHPVHTVSWYDVVKWLNARSEKEGRTPVYYTDETQTVVYRTGQVDVPQRAVKWDADGYRLPTEAEWEYAARAGTTTRFYTGNCISSDTQANYNGYYRWRSCPVGSNRLGTTEVGSFPANPWGIFDMAGNVWEWVWDVWKRGVGYASHADIDPRGAVSGTGRAFRGGGWGGYPYGLRSAGRDGSAPYDRFVNTGFRSVLSLNVCNNL